MNARQLFLKVQKDVAVKFPEIGKLPWSEAKQNKCTKYAWQLLAKWMSQKTVAKK